MVICINNIDEFNKFYKWNEDDDSRQLGPRF